MQRFMHNASDIDPKTLEVLLSCAPLMSCLTSSLEVSGVNVQESVASSLEHSQAVSSGLSFLNEAAGAECDSAIKA